MSYQYLRVSGAISQKRHEIQTVTASNEAKEHGLNAGRFVESGYNHVKQRFQDMKMLVMLSKGQDFITSDWPCFDMKDSCSSPILGEEIGSNPDVVVYMAITPKIGVVLFHSKFCTNLEEEKIPDVTIQSFSNSVVRNQNTLVIQQAERFVVACADSSFIYQVAKKRKKSRSTHV